MKKSLSIPIEVRRAAVVSSCRGYRYELLRWWDINLPFALFWMLNPSTADGSTDDPTIRKCMRFGYRIGCGGIVVVNWFAWRATDPKELPSVADPIGPLNRDHIKLWITECRGPIVAAWGRNELVRNRLIELPGLIGDRRLSCFAINKDGSPKHPLYVRGSASLVPFESPVAIS